MFSELSPHCFTGQATSIGPALATEVKEVPAPIHIQIQFIRPPPPRVQTHVWLSPLMTVDPFPQSDLNRFGNPQGHTAGIILRVCGEIPKISARLGDSGDGEQHSGLIEK
jgi:hypothetical protein